MHAVLRVDLQARLRSVVGAHDFVDPTQNIVWVTPEGGGGPNYPNM